MFFEKMTPFKARFCERYFWIKYSLFAMNFLIWVGGICLVVIGAWSRAQKAFLNSVDIALMTDPALFLVAVGVIMFVISIFGCLGSVKEHILLLKIFCVVMICVFILQVIAGILAFVFIDHVEQRILDYMRTSIETYRTDGERQAVIDYIQERFECCGSSSYADWDLNLDYNCSSESQLHCSVPVSCCRTRTSISCGLDSRRQGESHAANFVYTRGCTGFLMSLYIDNLIVIGSIAFAVAFLEIVAIILGHLLINYVLFSQLNVNVKSKKEARERENQYPSTTADKAAEFTRL